MGKRGKGFHRVLLKLSGEALAGKAGHGIDPTICRQIADEIAAVHRRGVEMGIVIGGGNFMRGATATAIERTAADAMGMLATMINSLALAHFIEEAECPSKVLTATAIEGVGERYSPLRAREYLSQGKTVIIAGGTGNPFFTTDTAAALRCAEIGADILLKATKVDGIYDSDPMKNPEARKLERITHAEALQKNLRVMDATAFSFCLENDIPIMVFKLLEKGNLLKSIEGRKTGSIVTTGGR
jgi:uridylate kinase